MGTNIATEYHPLPLEAEEHKAKIKGIIGDMLAFTQQLVVNSEVSYMKITSIYRQAREWKKSIEGKRKEMVEPLRKQMSAINDKAKEISDPLDEVIDLANAKSTMYQRMLEEMKRQKDEEIRAAAALFDAEEEIYIPPMEKNIRGNGTVSVTKVKKKFRLSDISKVPLKYLIVDEKAVERDLNLGISEIPGLEVYEETTTQLRLR